MTQEQFKKRRVEKRLREKRAKRILKAAIKKRAAEKIPFGGIVQDRKTRIAIKNRVKYENIKAGN